MVSLKTRRSPRRSSDGQVAHRAVVQAVGCDVEQARGVARMDGPLGYELVGEVEVEEIDAHLQRVQYDAMADFSTRLATADDAAAIARVFSPSFRLLSFLPMLHTEEEDRWFIENVILKECVVTVAEGDKGIVAFLALQGEEVRMLYAHPDFIGTGRRQPVDRRRQAIGRGGAGALVLPGEHHCPPVL